MDLLFGDLRQILKRATGSDLVRNVAQSLLTRVFMLVVGLATSVVVARALGPEGRGLYAVTMAIGAIGVQLANLGLHASNTYHVARNPRSLPALLGNSLLVSYVLGSAAAAIAGLFFLAVPRAAPVPASLLVLGLAAVPIGLGFLLLQNLLLGIQQVGAYNKNDAINRVLSTLLILAVVAAGAASVETVVAPTLVALGAVSLLALRRLLLHSRLPPRPSLAVLGQTIGYGIKAYLAALFAFLVIRSDVLMVSYLRGARETGYYSVAATMAEIMVLLPAVVATILFPKLSALERRDDKWRITRTVTLGTGAFLAVIIAPSALLASPLVGLLFGTDFLPAATAYLWLAPGIWFLGVQTVIVQYLNSIGFPRSVVVVWFVGAVFNVAFNLWAIPRHGITGAAVVSSISYFLVFAAVLAIVRASRRGRG